MTTLGDSLGPPKCVSRATRGLDRVFPRTDAALPEGARANLALGLGPASERDPWLPLGVRLGQERDECGVAEPRAPKGGLQNGFVQNRYAAQHDGSPRANEHHVRR